MTWADGQAQKAAAYLERHERDIDGWVHIAGWAVEEAALMIRDFNAEIAKLREVNAAQAEQLHKAQERIRAAEAERDRAWNEAIEAAANAAIRSTGNDLNAAVGRAVTAIRSLAKDAGE